MTEIERLQKEINGKVVVLVAGDLVIDCILLWPPCGGQVSFKPYGYTHEEVAQILMRSGYRNYSIEDVSQPEFCIASTKTKAKALNVLKYIAAVGEGDSLVWEEIKKRETPDPLTETKRRLGLVANPSCPYG